MLFWSLSIIFRFYKIDYDRLNLLHLMIHTSVPICLISNETESVDICTIYLQVFVWFLDPRSRTHFHRCFLNVIIAYANLAVIKFCKSVLILLNFKAKIPLNTTIFKFKLLRNYINIFQPFNLYSWFTI